ncbi:MAG: DegT/DnrJ/EryC1/StrS family aminotransferase, partial [Bacteroidales bacterium]|nr:DegT/DnrJ/EryC1/StrS family aminotransferase [Bacteroidales bacterium]
MEKIQMVDLLSSHSAVKQELDAAIYKVIDSSSFINGPQVKEFEENLARYLKVRHVVSCGNGTDALQIALMALGLEPGDQVLVPAFTYVATAEVIALLHLVPVMYDVNPRTFNTDSTSFEHIEDLITEKTRAIVPVHLFGQCSDMDTVLYIAKKHNLKVVEDCAQALGSDFKGIKAGCLGDIGCTSFFPTKNLGGMGDGGAMFTNDDTLAQRIRMIANHGQKVKYHHDIIGCNSRLDTLQAAILGVKLRHLDEYIAARKKNAASYTRQLKAIDPLEKHFYTPLESDFTTHTYHQYTIIVKDSLTNGVGQISQESGKELSTRDSLKAFLAEKGVPSMIYYPL